MASRYGYEVEEVVVGKFDNESIDLYTERNTHKVPKETIYKQAMRFEL